MGFWLVALLASLSAILSALLCLCDFSCSVVLGWFVIDSCGVYLCCISLLFSLVLLLVCWEGATKMEVFCLAVSAGSSVLCFLSEHAILFWVFYELTILPLLVALFCGSSYSERFLAGWYFVCYILATSVPLLLVIILMSVGNSSFSLSSWNVPGTFLPVLALVLFSTKVPLPPFHGWLPVVHAEAGTFVSVALSGYVMKLGVIGLLRFCSQVWASTPEFVWLIFLFSLGFFLSASSELDVKRWLAFLSLSHILVALLGLVFSYSGGYIFSAVYCLGHGVSASLLFYLFLLCYSSSGSRNWYIVVHTASSGFLWKMLVVLGLLTVSSFPPSISFFSEVYILSASLPFSCVLLLFQVYLFFGGLVPLVLVGFLSVNATRFSGISVPLGVASALVFFGLFSVWLLGIFWL